MVKIKILSPKTLFSGALSLEGGGPMYELRNRHDDRPPLWE